MIRRYHTDTMPSQYKNNLHSRPAVGQDKSFLPPMISLTVEPAALDAFEGVERVTVGAALDVDESLGAAPVDGDVHHGHAVALLQQGVAHVLLPARVGRLAAERHSRSSSGETDCQRLVQHTANRERNRRDGFEAHSEALKRNH